MRRRVFLAVLERDPSEVFPPMTQAHVRAAEQPLSTKLQHDCGLAVIKRTAIQKPRQWAPAAEQRKNGERSNIFRRIGQQRWPRQHRKEHIRQEAQKDSRRALGIPVEQGGELEHIIQCDGR